MTSRTLQIQSPAIPIVLGQPALAPVRLSGRECINELFEYELLLKTPDSLNLGASGAADFNLDDFIGREIGCLVELDGGAPRQINALITDAAFWGEEGRHVQYRLTLRPWLHLATLSTDCRIFQNQSVVQILDALLAGYAFPIDKRLLETYPVRDYQTQYNESDFDFFSRLCQEWGISYHFEHSEGKHRLVLCDAMGAYGSSENTAYQRVEYHPPGWKLDAEYLHSVVPWHRLTSGRYAARDYDYSRPRADLGVSRKDPRPTGQADQEVYQWHHPQAGSHFAQPRAGAEAANDPQGEGRQLALLRMQALRTHGARVQASGNLRGMAAGRTFKLARHPRESANAEYLILETCLLIEDVSQDSQIREATAGRKQQWRVSVDLTAHSIGEALRPMLTRSKPFTHGPEVALVVGPEGQNLWTDELGRIKVQFPWDRLGHRNQHSTCWIRVSSPWAGNQLGGIHIPRIGQEVIVNFVGGDPDLPVCMGRVHNQSNLPPWALPGQSALSGFRSRELTKEGGNSAAGRSNHLVLDDTEARIQAQLKSDHQHSQLSLGHITRIEDNVGRKDPRGEGFELRTDGHGVVRAADGLLITTEARGRASGHIKSMEETLARLAGSREQHENLSAAARLAEAHAIGDQDEVTQALKAQNDAIKGKGGHRAEGSFPELADPHLVLASPAGIESTTAQSTHMASGEHHALTSGGHTSVSSGKSFLVSVKQAIRMFSYKAGIRLVAAAANIEFKALQQSIHLLARLDITHAANRITITAKEEVLINGGGSFSRWTAQGIEHGTQGRWVEHAASHSLVGPMSRPVEPITFPRADLSPSSHKDAAYPFSL